MRPLRIRDDRPHAPRPAVYQECDFVLYRCPDCGRSHFVTVDPCPDAKTAARETAMVDARPTVAA